MSFELHGTRELIEVNGLPPTIEDRVQKLEESVASGSNDSFDHAKSLVESVCKTILLDKGAEVTPNSDIKSLLNQVMNLLPLIDPAHPLSEKGSKRLKSILSGIRQTVQGLAEMRNLAGYSSHGPDGYMEPLDKIHMRLSAMSADALTCFLLSLHRKLTVPEDMARIYYEYYPEFNDFFDEIYDQVILEDMVFRPSSILFNDDPEHVAYREKLLLFRLDILDFSELGE